MINRLDRAPAVIVDRDGVLNDLVFDLLDGVGESPLRWEDVRLAPGAAKALGELHRFGARVFCATNQPAAAKGKCSVEDLLLVQRRVEELLMVDGIRLDGVKMCFHHPSGVVASLSGVCGCRKPATGLLDALSKQYEIDLAKSWMVGDMLGVEVVCSGMDFNMRL